MSRLADPALCPDCRGRVGPDAVCASCGLALTGPLATDLWRTMLAADDLVERLRRAAAPAAVVRADPTLATDLPRYPSPRPATARAGCGLPGRVVPLVLLGIGGLFVLVAVSLFLAVTWSVLPLTVKAVLMLAVTGSIAAGAVLLSRRGLRGASETFWTLVAGMLALDLSAAWRSDLLGLGALDDRVVVVVGGLLLMALGLGAGLWARRTPVTRSVAAEAVLVLGALGAVADGLWNGALSDGPGQAAGAVVLAGAGASLLPRLREAAYAVLGLAVVSWALLALVGLADGAAAGSRGTYWGALGAWQLLVTAALAAAVTLLRRTPPVRTTAATGALAGLAAYVLLPGRSDPLQWLLVAGVGLALAGVAATAPTVWARAASALGAVVVVGTVLTTLVLPVALAADLRERTPLWTAPAGLAGGTGVATWPVLVLLVASGVVVTASLWLLGDRRAVVRRVAVASVTGLSGLGAAAALGGTTAPLWLVVGVLALTGVASAATAARSSDHARTAAGVLAAESLLLALVEATASDELTAVLATVLALLAGAALAPTRRSDAGRGPGVASVLLAAYAAYAWALVGGSDVGERAVVLAATAAAGLLAARYVAPHPATRLAVELATVAPGLVAVTTAVDDPAALAVVLTVLGSALALVGVLSRDRATAGWAASGLLAAATLTRATHDTALAPEAYALPAAVVLLAAGLWRLRSEPEHPTWPLLGSGLTLALAPSLLLALPDPTSTRALLVGVGGAVALGLGAGRRWQAPFLVGSAVLVVLALRFLGPLAGQVLADPLGAWVLFGLAGAALLAAGTLWEGSLARLRTASRHLTAMR